MSSQTTVQSGLDLSIYERVPRGSPRFYTREGSPIASIMANTYKLTLDTLLDAARTTLAAVVSLLLARILKLPEFYWAPISAIVIIQSTIDPRTLAWQRFAGTALGAVMGALIATFFSSGVWVYAIAILLCGTLCSLLRLRG